MPGRRRTVWPQLLPTAAAVAVNKPSQMARGTIYCQIVHFKRVNFHLVQLPSARSNADQRKILWIMDKGQEIKF